MSAPQNNDPRLDQAAVTDESLLNTHEKILAEQKDDGANYALGPLVLLFVFSGLIFFAGTYLNRYSGHFHATVYDEETPEHYHLTATAAAAPQVDPIEQGRKLYVTCAACHQPTGMGLAPVFPPLAGSEWVTGSEDRLIRIVLHGLQGPIKVKGTDFNGVMPGLATALNDTQIASILTFVRQEWGNQAGPITKEKVAEVRAATGAHPAWTAAQLEAIP